MVGCVRVKFPAVTVWELNVNTATALLLWVELYKSQQSNAVPKVTVVQAKLAEGVQYVMSDALAGALALVTVTPPAV